jgi:hypothetical protein
MKKTILKGGFIAILPIMMLLSSLPVALPAAYATPVDDCKIEIDQVETALSLVTISGNNEDRTRTSLESKLSGADTKLDDDKFSDAERKLMQFKDKIESLNTPNSKGIKKIGDDTAVSNLINEIDDAIVCVQGL